MARLPGVVKNAFDCKKRDGRPGVSMSHSASTDGLVACAVRTLLLVVHRNTQDVDFSAAYKGGSVDDGSEYFYPFEH